jgi:hypothetical protein
MSEYTELLTELKLIKALLAMDRVKDLEMKKDKILFLDNFGFTDAEIAALVGSTPGSVAVERSKAKKKKTKSTQS